VWGYRNFLAPILWTLLAMPSIVFMALTEWNSGAMAYGATVTVICLISWGVALFGEDRMGAAARVVGIGLSTVFWAAVSVAVLGFIGLVIFNSVS
jgi:hypothetical protein